MNWELVGEIASSNAAIVFYVALVLFTYRKLQIRFRWDVERWEGLVAAAFNSAEKADLKTGNEKLDHALKEFSDQYLKMYKAEPSAMDLKDAALDLAKLAYEEKVNSVVK